MFVVAGCSGPLPNAVPLPLARSSPPVSHHLLHLPEIQSGMENPHPQPIYTSCLTSPRSGNCPDLGKQPRAAVETTAHRPRSENRWCRSGHVQATSINIFGARLTDKFVKNTR